MNIEYKQFQSLKKYEIVLLNRYYSITVFRF